MQIAHNKARLEQFSDGVFAIAITLLALELHVPQLIGADIVSSLKQVEILLPNILTFVLSFLAIAIFWVNHHQLTQEIGPIRRRVLWTNVLLLLFVTLIPFGTKVASANATHPIAVMTYAFILFGGSVSFSVLRYFVHRSCGERTIKIRRSLIGPFFYFFAMIVSVIFIPLAYLLLAIPPLYYFLPQAPSKPTS